MSSQSLEGGEQVCPQCKYDVTITVYGQDGGILGCTGDQKTNCEEATNGIPALSQARYHVTIPPSETANYSSEAPLHFEITLKNQGEYRIVRRIELDSSIVETYVDEHITSIPGTPSREEIEATASQFSFSQCELQACQGTKCEEMVRNMVARECDSLEMLARVDMQARAEVNGEDAESVENSVCPSFQDKDPDESAACCHVRLCRQEINQLIKVDTILWQLELGKVLDWESANARRLLDPLLAGESLPEGILPCGGSRSCVDSEGHVAARSEILERMLQYKVDPYTGTLMNVWDYVRLPQLEFSSEQQWQAFRGAYLALRAKSLVAAQNSTNCPYNEIVKAPDLSALDSSAEEQEQAAELAFAEHCASHCPSNVCNWRWQLSDRCDSYHPFGTNDDGRYDYPAYICGQDTPNDEVGNHLLSYCLRQCDVQNPFGEINEDDLESDPDLLVAQQIAGCDFQTIAGNLIQSKICCLDDCVRVFELTPCGKVVEFYLRNQKLLSDYPDGFKQKLNALIEDCPSINSVRGENDKVIIGSKCKYRLVSRNGTPVTLDQISDSSPIIGSDLADELDPTYRTSFSGLVVYNHENNPVYVLSKCWIPLISESIQCCGEEVKQLNNNDLELGFLSDLTGRKNDPLIIRKSKEIQTSPNIRKIVNREKKNRKRSVKTPVEKSVDKINECAEDSQEILRGLINPGYSRGQYPYNCIVGARRSGTLIEIQIKGGRPYWYELLSGKTAEPWNIQSGWSINKISHTRIPERYPRSRIHSIDEKTVVLLYTGVSLNVIKQNSERRTIYLYSNNPLIQKSDCVPVGGYYVLNLPPFEFDDWKKQCEEDTEELQDAQTNRLLDEGIDEAKEAFENRQIIHCMGGAVTESLDVQYQTAEYAHTLLYYDAVGNLVAIVPPKGVSRLQANNGTLSNTVVPNHRMLTSISYDSRNNILSRKTPDAGTTTFIYDSRGRRRFTQTLDQVERHEWSYKKYDRLDRVVETGVFRASDLPANIQVRFSQDSIEDREQIKIVADNLTFPSNEIVRSEVVKTSYGPVLVSDPVVQEQHDENATQLSHYLRGRVREIAAQSSETKLSYGYSSFGLVRLLNTEQPELGQKTTRYMHDPVDDVLRSLEYQVAPVSSPRMADEFRQRFEYDSERRVKTVLSSTDGVIWDRDARYDYYDHGPIRRLVLGEDEVQGVDYVYTIQGWLKAINAGDASSQRDPGGDSLIGNVHSTVPRDVLGLLITYFDQDYQPTTAPFMSSDDGTDSIFGPEQHPLFNGLIKSRVLTNRGLTADPSSVRNTYGYDQLGRLVTSRNVTSGIGLSEFETDYAYDLNGNLETVNRMGKTVGACSGNIDDRKHIYMPGNNSLIHVNDDAPATACDIDLDDQGSYSPGGINPNYMNDKAGRLKSDASENIAKIYWSATDKVLAIHQPDLPSYIEYSYDGLDLRSRVTMPDLKTYYVRHPNGKVLAIYEKPSGANIPAPKELVLYGGKDRLGTRMVDVLHEDGQLERVSGLIRYELVDQVGSVLAVVGDEKIGHDDNGDGISDRYTVNIISAADYYPYGMLKPGRQHGIGEYRFGFSGYERDTAPITQGDFYYTPARIYDTQGRWWIEDPIMDYSFSPYSAHKSNPISFTDPIGKRARRSTQSHHKHARTREIKQPHRKTLPFEYPPYHRELIKKSQHTPTTAGAADNLSNAVASALEILADHFAQTRGPSYEEKIKARRESVLKWIEIGSPKEEKVWVTYEFKDTMSGVVSESVTLTTGEEAPTQMYESENTRFITVPFIPPKSTEVSNSTDGGMSHPDYPNASVASGYANE
ncbi:MAG: RHS repeat-associated core domain-containing protein [Candidatus Thiodiazotropha sp.]